MTAISQTLPSHLVNYTVVMDDGKHIHELPFNALEKESLQTVGELS